jgi:hypothetical protein
MNPAKVDRNRLKRLEDLPNIGQACARYLRLLGINRPQDLLAQDPFEMHARLCHLTGHQQDPCMIDVFISVVRFMADEPPRPWWKFTAERKRILSPPGQSDDPD